MQRRFELALVGLLILGMLASGVWYFYFAGPVSPFDEIPEEFRSQITNQQGDVDVLPEDISVQIQEQDGDFDVLPANVLNGL